MIAYRGMHAVAIEPNGGEEEPVIFQPVHEPNSSIAASVEPATPAPSDGGATLISVIDPRTLGRDVLTRALQAADSRFRGHAYAHVDEWLQDDPISRQTSAILLGIGATSADDLGLVKDLQFLAQEFPHIPTIVIGEIEASSHVAKILGYGARGYIPTSVSLTVAIGAICLAQAGGLFAPASSLMLSHQAPRETAQATGSGNHMLTERQTAVADALSQGKANKIIAYELNLCESTVKVHVRSIMKKLQARNRTEVAFKLHNLMPRHVAPVQTWSSSIRA